MAIEHTWKRRDDDWPREMDRAIAHLQEQAHQAQADLSQLKVIVLGDQAHHEDGLETRLHQVERHVDKLNIVTVGEPGTHKGGLMEELVNLRGDIVNLRFDLKAIREDKAIKVERRRDTLAFWAPVLSGWIAFAGIVLMNLDKLGTAFSSAVRPLSAQDKALNLERLRREIVELRQRRGPKVEKKLKALEEAAKKYQEGQ